MSLFSVFYQNALSAIGMGNTNNTSNKTASTTSSSSNSTARKPQATTSKTSPQKPTTSPKQDADSSAFSLSRLENLFNKYKDEDDQIGPTEIEKFCKDLAVDPEDVVMIVLAYHLNCKEMGVFSRDEFIKGFEAMGCDTLDKIKTQLPKLKKELDEPSKFQAIYKFAFQFAREGEQKCIGLEIAQGLLGLILVDRYPIAKSFVEFLKCQESYKVLNADQWASLLEFCKAIQPNFANYDENGAWPCILDEWVAWVKDGKPGSGSGEEAF